MRNLMLMLAVQSQSASATVFKSHKEVTMQHLSKKLLGGAALNFVTARAFAQVPVIDSATLSQATTTASKSLRSWPRISRF